MRNPLETPPLCHCWLRSPDSDCRSFLNGYPISPNKTQIRSPPSTPWSNLSSLPLESVQSSTGDDAGEFQLHPRSPHPQRWLLQFVQRLHRRAC